MVPRLEPCATARHAFPATTVTLPWQARLGIELGRGDGTGVGPGVGALLGFDDGALDGGGGGQSLQDLVKAERSGGMAGGAGAIDRNLSLIHI